MKVLPISAERFSPGWTGLSIAAALSIVLATTLSTAAEMSPADRGNARPGDSADHVRIASLQRDGDKDQVTVTVTIDPGFHINANPASFDYLISTKLDITNQPPLRVAYPPPVSFKPKFSDEPLAVYEGTARIVAAFPQGVLNRTPYLFGTLTVQACTIDICLPPADLPLPRH
jgi:uncharacterized protein